MHGGLAVVCDGRLLPAVGGEIRWVAAVVVPATGKVGSRDEGKYKGKGVRG
jgi:hypothetical protein